LQLRVRRLGGFRITMFSLRLLPLALVTACLGACTRPRPENASAPAPDASWVAKQPVECGEVRGRVLDQGGSHPIAEAFVTLDSAASGVTTDSLGLFRIALPRDSSSILTRPTFLRIRRIGSMEVRVLLPSDFGYVVEVLLAAGGFHRDHLETIRVKSPGFCGHAS